MSRVMNLRHSKVFLRGFGGLLLLVAGVRFVVRFVPSVHASEFATPEHGFVVGFSVDRTTLAMGVLGILLFVLGFIARSCRA
jgi:hypothetical protein